MFKWLSSLFQAGEKAAPVTLEQLQGRWRMVSVGKNGNFAPPGMFANVKIMMVIEGSRYTVISNGEQGDGGTIQVDSTKSPAHFDQRIDRGDDAGKSHLGIIRFREGMLEHCQADKGRERPKDFSRKRKDDASLACFRKVAS